MDRNACQVYEKLEQKLAEDKKPRYNTEVKMNNR